MRVLSFFVVLLSLGSEVLFAADVEFNRDVLPILSDKCFTCHGPDAAAKKIPFRLDSEAAAKAVLASGKHAVVEGKPEQSELVNRITTDKKALRMPPAYTGAVLSPAEIETLRTWIAEGAKWQQHWSFLPPRRAEPPQVETANWVRNPIDNFILARLAKEKLHPSAEAPSETLLRRVSFDLTGLPPTVSEVQSFLADKSPNAYEKAVDRLLASPRYGERMAYRWLDAARYADSNGYQYDAERTMWPWRDWVISAFNSNKPFNDFTVEQIAGDLLPNATHEQKIATGFNRNHRLNTEDGIIPEEYAVEYVVDRVEATSTVFMGLTLGCARCHNHKYDPLTQKEFYQVFAYFNNVPELGRAMKYGNSPPLEPAPTADQQRELSTLDGGIKRIQEFLARRSSAIDKGQTAWEHGLRATTAQYWAPPGPLEASYPMGDVAEKGISLVPGRIGKAARFDGTAFLDAGDKGGLDIQDQFTISAWVFGEESPDGPILSRMEDKAKGKGYAIGIVDGRLHVELTSTWADDAIRLNSDQQLQAKRWYHVAMTYSGSRMAEGIHLFIDGKPAAVNVELDSLYRPFRNAGKAFKDPLRIGGGWGPERRFRGLLDEVNLYHRMLSADEISALAVGESIQQLAAKSRTERTPQDQYQLRRYYLENEAAADVRTSWRELLDLQHKREEQIHNFPTVMVMAERPQPKDTFVLVRGAYNVHGEKVNRGVPAVLPPLPEGEPNNRLGFANWLVSPNNPLLARVTVNRFWQTYFGTGLVKTTEDFGRQGEWPSHPELLDWLATEFIRTGWDVKALQKLIVTSAAYRQSSTVTPELQQRDPENRLLARGPRFRLSAEEIRDQALSAAGLLVEKIGGPPVKPYQPEGLWKEISMQDMDYVQGHGDDLHRRSLYTYWKRTVAPPMLANFDSALRESCVVRETRTNTPLQALNLMNDVTFLEAARFIGQRMLREGGKNDTNRVRFGFLLVTGREPSASEQALLLDDLRFHRDYFASKPERVDLYLNQGESRTDPTLDHRELAAYASLGSLLLNLDETVTKQ